MSSFLCRQFFVCALIPAAAACSSSTTKTTAAPTPAPARASVGLPLYLPDDPCDMLTVQGAAKATGLPIRIRRRVPDIGEIVRAQREARVARSSAICSYDGDQDGEFTIVIPDATEQTKAAFERDRDMNIRATSGQIISGLGNQAWLARGTTLHVLGGTNNVQFMITARTRTDKTRDMLVAMARAALANLGIKQ